MPAADDASRSPPPAEARQSAPEADVENSSPKSSTGETTGYKREDRLQRFERQLTVRRAQEQLAKMTAMPPPTQIARKNAVAVMGSNHLPAGHIMTGLSSAGPRVSNGYNQHPETLMNSAHQSPVVPAPPPSPHCFLSGDSVVDGAHKFLDGAGNALFDGQQKVSNGPKYSVSDAVFFDI